ncbi:hypothetical protein CLAIMM_04808 [Cladophialophora immunda]|nr:hypothetical protein CLAIMM_04808 [Cladophialophora immunda]
MAAVISAMDITYCEGARLLQDSQADIDAILVQRPNGNLTCKHCYLVLADADNLRTISSDKDWPLVVSCHVQACASLHDRRAAYSCYACLERGKTSIETSVAALKSHLQSCDLIKDVQPTKPSQRQEPVKEGPGAAPSIPERPKRRSRPAPAMERRPRDKQLARSSRPKALVAGGLSPRIHSGLVKQHRLLSQTVPSHRQSLSDPYNHGRGEKFPLRQKEPTLLQTHPDQGNLVRQADLTRTQLTSSTFQAASPLTTLPAMTLAVHSSKSSRPPLRRREGPSPTTTRRHRLDERTSDWRPPRSRSQNPLERTERFRRDRVEPLPRRRCCLRQPRRQVQMLAPTPDQPGRTCHRHFRTLVVAT